MRVYMMEAAFLARLRADRKELWAIARSLGTAEQMRQAREELMASTRINLTPKEGETPDPAKLYKVDAEGVAHIPMIGELTPAAEKDACGAYTASALTEYGFLQTAIRAADEDPRVSAIALDANTPGGYADGVDVTAQVFAAAKKPTMAIVADIMASGGFYIGSRADKIIALSPLSRVGSIGVVAEEYDDDRLLEAEGIDHRVFTSTDAPDKRPDTKTEEGRAKVVDYLNDTHRVFVSRVAEGRHTTVEDVNANYGRGGLVIASEAQKRGMIDEVRGVDIQRETAGVAGEKTAAKADGISKTGGAKTMTLEELKKDHPDLYAAVFNAGEESGMAKGITEGVNQERKRVEQLSAFKGINADGDKAADEAIRTGKAYAEVAPLIAAATARGKTPSADGDNPADVATAEQARVGGAVSAEAVRIGAKMGVTAADIKKFGGEPRKE
jgi:ClpP class serine protease